MRHLKTIFIVDLRTSEVLNFGISASEDETAKVFKNNGHQLPSDIASYPRKIEISIVITCSKF